MRSPPEDSNSGTGLPPGIGSGLFENPQPGDFEPWGLGGKAAAGKGQNKQQALTRSLQNAISHRPWQPPQRDIILITDPHADREALVESLLVSGGVTRNADGNLLPTPFGRQAQFIIGGDCMDKGPSNLEILRCIRELADTGVRLKLLAGNHDLRLFVGLRSLQLAREPRTEHLFIRMGPKVIPLLKEVHSQYLAADPQALNAIPDLRGCRQRLLPGKNWFREFPKAAAPLLTGEALDRELHRMRKKLDSFEEGCRAEGMSLRDIYAAALKLQQLFLQPDGEFFWFFRELTLLYQSGSFLFIHAGLDDQIIDAMHRKGIDSLNALYRQQLQFNLFEFYYGPVANTMRTKYRRVDLPLSKAAASRAQQLGIHAVVHGHRNRAQGQRLMLRRGLLHIEADITMDRNSRKKEGLTGIGIGATLFCRDGRVLGISNDHPRIKLFDPQTHLI